MHYDTARIRALFWKRLPSPPPGSFDKTAWFDSSRAQWGVAILQLISTRARLLSATRTIDEIALDKYSLLRDGYLARRRNLIYDGNPPDEPEAADNDDAEGTAPK